MKFTNFSVENKIQPHIFTHFFVVWFTTHTNVQAALKASVYAHDQLNKHYTNQNTKAKSWNWNAIVWWIFNSFGMNPARESDANMKSYQVLILSLECELIINNIGNHKLSNVFVRYSCTHTSHRIVVCVCVFVSIFLFFLFAFRRIEGVICHKCKPH